MATPGAALMKARGARYRAPGVEPGVTGKELRWQHNRAFGPGAFVPYPGGGQSPTRPVTAYQRPGPIPNYRPRPQIRRV
jgi:hypothetical protein